MTYLGVVGYRCSKSDCDWEILVDQLLNYGDFKPMNPFLAERVKEHRLHGGGHSPGWVFDIQNKAKAEWECMYPGCDTRIIESAFHYRHAPSEAKTTAVRWLMRNHATQYGDHHRFERARGCICACCKVFLCEPNQRWKCRWCRGGVAYPGPSMLKAVRAYEAQKAADLGQWPPPYQMIPDPACVTNVAKGTRTFQYVPKSAGIEQGSGQSVRKAPEIEEVLVEEVAAPVPLEPESKIADLSLPPAHPDSIRRRHELAAKRYEVIKLGYRKGR